jgi:hypothetical protein
MSGSLPQQFRELEKWSSWALATEGERYARRAGSSMEALTEFYQGLKPHMEGIIQYLSAFPWGTPLGEEDERLLHMGMSYMEAAVPIELGWKSPVAQDSFSVERMALPVRP